MLISAIVAAFACALMRLGGVELSAGALALALLLMLTLICAGQVLLTVFGAYGGKAALALALVTGFAAVSIPMVILTLLLKWSALQALVPLSALTLLLRWRVAVPPTARAGTQMAVVAALGLAIMLLARVPIAGPQALLEGGPLPIWNDYYIHGVTITSFGSPYSMATDMEVAGMARGFYHYAAFMLPAALLPVTHGSGLQLATTVLMPLGLLVGGMGLYALGAALGGSRCALLALTAVICLPAYAGLVESGWFDFYWLLLISPGSGYAIGVAAAAIAVLHSYFDKGNNRLLWLAGLLLCALVVVRAHMFLLLAPALVGAFALHQWPKYGRRIGFAAATTLLLACAALALSPPLRAQWLAFSQTDAYLAVATAWTQVWGLQVPLNAGGLARVAVQILIILVSVLGWYSLWYPASLALKGRRGLLEPIDWLVPLMALSFVLLILFAPPAGNGDVGEYKHRHFLLLFALVVVFTVANTWKLWLPRKLPSPAVTAFACAIVLAATAWALGDTNPAAPNFKAMEWTRAFHLQRLRPGVLQMGGYLGAHSEPGDVFAIDAASIGATANAPVIELIALSGVPAYVARPELRARISSCIKAEVEHRVTVLASLAQAQDRQAAANIMRDNGIRWYLTFDDKPPTWDPDLHFVSLRADGIALYDNGPSPHAAARLRVAC